MYKKKWKYAKERPKFNYDEYFKLEVDETAIVDVKSPEIIQKLIEGDNRTVFQAVVTSINGEPTEKTLIIKNYDNVQLLKKKLGKKKEMKMELARRYDKDEMEYYYDIKILS